MNQIIVEPTTDSQFRAAQEPVRVCDANGHVLGYFTPAPEQSLYKTVEPPSSEVELLRRARIGGGRTLAEIMADLAKQP